MITGTFGVEGKTKGAPCGVGSHYRVVRQSRLVLYPSVTHALSR